MSIVASANKLKEILNQPVTDLDHVDLINEKGLYQIFEGLREEKAYFGLYLAQKTLKRGLEDAYASLDEIIKVLKKRENECMDIEVDSVALVRFTERLFIYHIKVKTITT